MILEKGSRFYLFSDGYQDQFGGPRFKKFKKTNFNKTLQTVSKLPILDQRNALNDIIEEWRGKYPQVDDILVLGIAF
jgi:serine phosphatase RsbU (regulator of sigma subunit)